jgi:hypothetical protein
MVSMDVDADKEALFNDVYDQEHVPNLLRVPGVHAARRTKAEPSLKLNIGGEEKVIPHQGPTYCAIYEIDSPEVLVSPEWAAAGEAGRWPSQVRPFTRNRRHSLYKIL